MSQTATQFDVKADLIGRLNQITASYLNDLKFVPEDKLGKSPMGVARSPLEFTAEVIGFNGLVANAVRGAAAEMPDKATIEAFYASIDSFEKARAGLEASVAKLSSAIEGATLEQLGEPITAPWGDETTKLMLCNMAVSHMTYHDGQLNYIQALYGDAENHWH